MFFKVLTNEFNMTLLENKGLGKHILLNILAYLLKCI